MFFCRLRDPWKCPANGSHFDKCDCENDDYKLSGGSYFSKIRINLSTMKIIGELHQKLLFQLHGLQKNVLQEFSLGSASNE